MHDPEKFSDFSVVPQFEFFAVIIIYAGPLSRKEVGDYEEATNVASVEPARPARRW